jgi:hypothetical protein
VAKYRALRQIGMDPVSAWLVALVSMAVQTPSVIRVLNLEIEVEGG